MSAHHQFDDHCGVSFVRFGQTPISIAAHSERLAVLLRLLECDLLSIIALLPHYFPPRVRDSTVSIIHKPFLCDKNGRLAQGGEVESAFDVLHIECAAVSFEVLNYAFKLNLFLFRWLDSIWLTEKRQDGGYKHER